MTDSTASGYLLGQTDVPEDDDLIDLYQPIVVAIGGWDDPSVVRPRWQIVDVPNMPDIEDDWCSLGIARSNADTFITEYHVGDGTGYDLVEYTEDIELMCSCYGPNAQSYARKLKVGFQIEQNRVDLQALNTDTLFATSPVLVPLLLHSKWQRRCDITINLRRRVSIKYNVRNIVQAQVSISPGPHFVNPFLAPLKVPS